LRKINGSPWKTDENLNLEEGVGVVAMFYLGMLVGWLLTATLMTFGFPRKKRGR
jgi:hypothetical protein